MKLVDVDSDTCIDFDVGTDDGDSKFKIGVMLEYQNVKKMLQKFWGSFCGG